MKHPVTAARPQLMVFRQRVKDLRVCPSSLDECWKLHIPEDAEILQAYISASSQDAYDLSVNLVARYSQAPSFLPEEKRLHYFGLFNPALSGIQTPDDVIKQSWILDAGFAKFMLLQF